MEKMYTFNVRINEEQRVKLEGWQEELGLSRSDIVRLLIDETELKSYKKLETREGDGRGIKTHS